MKERKVVYDSSLLFIFMMYLVSVENNFTFVIIITLFNQLLFFHEISNSYSSTSGT